MDDLPAPDPGAARPPAKWVPRRATETLAKAAFLEAVPAEDRRLVRERRSFALVLEVPSAEWVKPMRLACEAFVGWSAVFARSGATRADDRADKGNDLVGTILADGGRVLGVSQSPERYLPSALLASADLRARVPAPSNEVVARVIRAATRQRPAAMPAGVAAGLDYPELCAAVRINSTARSCIERLVAAQRSKSILDPTVAQAPPLEELHGYGDAQEWGLRLLADIEEWRAGRLPFAALDRHAVLASEPGLGKTTFVRSLARSARLPLVSTSVAAWFSTTSGYLDTVIKAVDTDFARARAASPSFLFLDEIDALPDRAALSGDKASWWTPLVTHVLLTLDAALAGTAAPICVIGATNHRGRIDAALVRPGRLTRVIEIPRPDATALAGILRQHLGSDLADDDLALPAALAAGGTGADAAHWVEGARRRARLAGRAMAIDDLVAEIAPTGKASPEMQRRFAVHEAGHAVLSHFLEVAEVQSVALTGRTDGNPSTLMRRLYGDSAPRAALEDVVVVALGGRSAEIVILGAPSSGAGGSPDSDLAHATRMTAAIHASYGLGASLLHRATPESASDLLPFDPSLRRVVHDDLLRLQGRAVDHVRANRAVVEAVADALLAARYLSGPAFRNVVADWRWRTDAPSTRARARGGCWRAPP